jgi:hypothetical protein
MGDISTIRFAINLNVVNCGIRCVQCSLKGFGMCRDCEYSPTRCDDFIVGPGRSSMEDNDICRDPMSRLR